MFTFMCMQVQGIPSRCAGGNRCGSTWPGRTWRTGEGDQGCGVVWCFFFGGGQTGCEGE
jgi:hypothetical protein